MEGLLMKRIKNNEKLFNKLDLKLIQKNVILIQKIYILGIVDGNIERKN